MFKSVKATYTFSRKIKLTYLTASKSEKQNILPGVVMKKFMVVNTTEESRSFVKDSVLEN